MKPEEFMKIGEWCSRHTLLLSIQVGWMIIYGMIGGTLFFDHHDHIEVANETEKFISGFIVPMLMAGINSTVVGLRTIPEKREQKKISREVRIKQLEKELEID